MLGSWTQLVADATFVCSAVARLAQRSINPQQALRAFFFAPLSGEGHITISYLSIYLPYYRSIVSIFFYLSISLSIYLSTYLSSPSIQHPSVHLSTHLCIHLRIVLLIHLNIYLSIYLSIHLLICLSTISLSVPDPAKALCLPRNLHWTLRK